jgi:hypothetical protein
MTGYWMEAEGSVPCRGMDFSLCHHILPSAGSYPVF